MDCPSGAANCRWGDHVEAEASPVVPGFLCLPRFPGSGVLFFIPDVSVGGQLSRLFLFLLEFLGD